MKSNGRPLFVALALAFLLSLTSSLPAAAQAPDRWRVAELAGEAVVTRAGVAPVALTDKVELQGGEQIRTEATGRVVLRRGNNDTLLIAPNSLIALPASDDGLFTRIVQTFGTILVKVEKRPDPHFEVRTPFLAAIVKGTTFTVSADAVSSAVQVVEGVVAVADASQRQTVTVTAGQTARINSQTGGGLRIDGPRQNAPGPADKGASAAAGGRGDDGAQHISQPIGPAKIDAEKASGGLLRNDDGKAPAAPRLGAGSDQARGNAAPNSSDGAGGQGAGGPAASIAGLAKGNGANARANAGANGNGNGNGHGNGHGH